MSISQKFTKVVDDEDEAVEFGEEAAIFAYGFMRGFGSHDPDNN